MQAVEFRTSAIRPVECFKEGWVLIKDQYWLFFGITVVGGLIAAFSMYILLGAMFCGIFYCFSRKADHKPVEFADLFKGFQYFLPSLIVALFFIVPNLLIAVMNFAFQFIITAGLQRNPQNPGIIWTILGIYLAIITVLAVLMACLHALIIFAFPLIVEHNLSGIEAFKLSARAALKNLGGVVGIIAIQFGMLFAGMLACYVGMLFVFPLLYAGVFVAYRKVFPSKNPTEFNEPPPPSSFQNAGQPI